VLNYLSFVLIIFPNKISLFSSIGTGSEYTCHERLAPPSNSWSIPSSGGPLVLCTLFPHRWKVGLFLVLEIGLELQFSRPTRRKL